MPLFNLVLIQILSIVLLLMFLIASLLKVQPIMIHSFSFFFYVQEFFLASLFSLMLHLWCCQAIFWLLGLRQGTQCLTVRHTLPWYDNDVTISNHFREVIICQASLLFYLFMIFDTFIIFVGRPIFIEYTILISYYHNFHRVYYLKA